MAVHKCAIEEKTFLCRKTMWLEDKQVSIVTVPRWDLLTPPSRWSWSTAAKWKYRYQNKYTETVFNTNLNDLYRSSMHRRIRQVRRISCLSDHHRRKGGLEGCKPYVQPVGCQAPNYWKLSGQPNNLWKQSKNLIVGPGGDPIKLIFSVIYSMPEFEPIRVRKVGHMACGSQWECLKSSVKLITREYLFIGSCPGEGN